MKTKIYFIIFFAIILVSCEKFLTKEPLDQISSGSYWGTKQDLLLYVNQFYQSSFPTNPYTNSNLVDGNSDNLILEIMDAQISGERVVPPSGGGWDWTNIRSVNYFMTHYQKVKDPWPAVSQYVGEAYFFRAYYYFNMVIAFGDVPWINKELNSNSPELFMPRTARNVVIDSIIADLDKAISYMKPKGQVSNSRLNSEVALLFKSRVCLREGTWEKYNAGTVFGVTGSDGKKYITLARDAAKQLIDEGLYSIYSEGKPYKNYLHLFGKQDYSTNPEVLFWRKKDLSLSIRTRIDGQYQEGLGRGLSKSLVDSYLCMDGLPITKSTLYQGDNTIQNVVKNRDPRLVQMMWMPGDPINVTAAGDTNRFGLPLINLSGEYLCTTGYQKKKNSDFDENLTRGYTREDGTVGEIIFRYAEALLIYAEARAELGEITQSDIDMTINKIRDRVGVPHLQLDNIASDPQWDYPTLSPIINEIRRERRVELACEGLRLDDIKRWHAHNVLLNKKPLGAKFIQANYPTMIIGKNVNIDANGYIDFYKVSFPKGYGFNPDRDYLDPIPSVELTLNEKISQNPGWL